MARKDREKMSNVQQSLADKKLEAAKLTHKAAQEHTKCKMLDTYKELMFASTSHLSQAALAERDRALEGAYDTEEIAACACDIEEEFPVKNILQRMELGELLHDDLNITMYPYGIAT
ncbi:hypothetical protein C2845_PM16G24400 [Panicum miliaceum]|uniref:Uncharacterized protein n=1 Tax=Panicum miliaceum TaxID=4540 RepID=A0A3L6PUH1_PANMI|nr:hypothetical protein C2845_PM16G24400 [Panicum miliaceum]